MALRRPGSNRSSRTPFATEGCHLPRMERPRSTSGGRFPMSRWLRCRSILEVLQPPAVEPPGLLRHPGILLVAASPRRRRPHRDPVESPASPELAVNWGGYDCDRRHPAGNGVVLAVHAPRPNTRDFAWEPGARYRLTIGPAPPASRARAGGRPGSRVSTPARTCWCATSCATGDHLRSPVVWSELFTRCDDPPIEVRWSEPSALGLDGEPVPVDRGRVTYQAYEAGGCTNTTVEPDEVGIVQRSGCERRTAHDTLVGWRT